MYRMEAKKRRANRNVRRYIVFAVFCTMLLIMTTVVFGEDRQKPPPEYRVSTAPAALLQSEVSRAVPTPAAVPTPTPAMMAAILADGQRIGAVPTMQDAQAVLDGLMGHYTALHPDEADVTFAQAVEIAAVPLDAQIVSPEELYLTWRNAIDNAALYALACDTEQAAESAGESALTAVDVDVLYAAPISISAGKTETQTETIPYETETIEDGNMVIGAKNVDIDGKNGERVVTYRYTYLNGVMVACEVLEETVTLQPIGKVVRVGTRKPYAQPGNDGTVPHFIMPVSGRISSYYGMRRGRMHYGIDIVTSLGKPLAASLGGTVTFASENGNYGLLVEIDHGNGFVTRYGHNSQILVSVGQHVSRGEVIALIGETGNAACPHVHFEIRLNGSAVDPMPYLD